MLSTYLSVLRRRWSMVVLATIILTPMAFLVLTASSGVYQSTAIVQVLNASVAEGVLGTARGYQDPERLLASEIEVLTSPAVAEGAADRLQDDGWQIDAEAVRDSIEVSPRGVSSYIEVIGSRPAPARAQQLTSAFVDSYRAYKLDLQREELERLDEELRVRLAETEAELVELDAAAADDGAAARQRAALLGRYESLSRLIEDIRLRLSVDTSGVEVLTQASEPEPVSGALDTVPAAVASLVAAAAVASALAVLIDLLRDPVRTREEGERLVPGASVVVLPAPVIDGVHPVDAVNDPHSPAARAARSVQQRWAPARRGSGGRVLVVTSVPEDGQQRVYVATALAAAAGRAGRRVLLVGELLDRVLLTGDLSDREVDVHMRGVHETALPGVWWTAGTATDDAQGSVETHGSALLEEFDLVVRVREDGAADTDVLNGPVPFVVVVATLGRTRARLVAAHAREQEAAGLPVSGVVLVDQGSGRKRSSRRSARSDRRRGRRSIHAPGREPRADGMPALARRRSDLSDRYDADDEMSAGAARDGR